MNRALTASFALSLAGMLAAACSANDAITPGTGGTGGMATGTSGTGTMTGGTGTMTGGNTSVAGTTTGGSAVGTSGSSGTGTGGTGTSGSGGTGTSGSAGTGGGGGAGGGAAVGCMGDCTALVGKADGWVNSDPPDHVDGSDGIQEVGAVDATPTTMCAQTEGRPDHGLPFKEAHWQLKGPGIVKDTKYAVTFHFTGVLECKAYANTAMCPGAANSGRNSKYNLWCPGGTDPQAAANHWNTVMLSVTPTSSPTAPNIGPQDKGPLPTAGNWWMLNECPAGVVESHKTWMVDYEQTIPVPGESWINFVEFDTNCREIVNCGTSDDSATACTDHFSISPPGDAVPAAPASVTTQPAAGNNGNFGQWVFLDVKSVKPM